MPRRAIPAAVASHVGLTGTRPGGLVARVGPAGRARGVARTDVTAQHVVRVQFEVALIALVTRTTTDVLLAWTLTANLQARRDWLGY